MSNRVQIRMMHCGRFTRPRYKWRGKRRGAPPVLAGEHRWMAAQISRIANVITRGGRQQDDRRATSWAR